MKSFRIFFVLILSLSIHVRSNANHEAFISKVAIIDIKYLLENSFAVKELKKALKVYNNKAAAAFELKEKELKALESKIKAKNINNLAVEKSDKDMAHFNERVKLLQKATKEKNLHIDSSYTKAMQEIDECTRKIVNRLSIKYNFNVVIPAGQIYWASDGIDITEEVLASLNVELPKSKFQLAD
jgi:Skp family chaperone for outer membrane proteins